MKNVADDRIKLFIANERDLDIIKCDWGKASWILDCHDSAVHTGVPAIYFGHGDARRGPIEPFDPLFDEFARALVCRFARQRLAKGGSSPYRFLLRALRTLHCVMSVRAIGPAQIIAADFDNAAKLAASRWGVGVTKQVTIKLKWITETVDKERLTERRLSWSPPLIDQNCQDVHARDVLLMTSDQLVAIA